MHKTELIMYALEALIALFALYKVGGVALRAWRSRQFLRK